MAIKWYKFGWSNEGIGWYRKGYLILKPTTFTIYWKVRRVNGKRGMQIEEFEQNFISEEVAFEFANKAIVKTRKEKKEKKRVEKAYNRALKVR